MQKRHRRALCASFILMLCSYSSAAAQAPGTSAVLEQQALRVYVDCDHCDMNYIRREIPFVSYVRERQDAQLHLLMTQQGAGGGGTQYRLHFIGYREFAGRADTLIYNALATDSDELQRRGLVRTMKLGLLPYVAETPQAAGLNISYTVPRPAEGGVDAEVRRDPWNYWTFRASLNGNANEEATRRNYTINGQFTANRTTEDWKANLRLNGRKNFTEIELSESTVRDENHNWDANGLLVRSLTPHLSAGVTSSLWSSVYSNYDLGFRFAPAIEYDLYPYSESSRRSFIFQYSVGVSVVDYEEETIYFKLHETLYQHAFEAGYGVQQTWGGARLSGEYSAYLHDMLLNRIQVNGNLDVNILRGLSFQVGGQYERVRDQLSLQRGELSDEEVLLNRRAQGTGHRIRGSVGMSYRFGSIFNNVVNTRFGGGGGGGG